MIKCYFTIRIRQCLCKNCRFGLKLHSPFSICATVQKRKWKKWRRRGLRNRSATGLEGWWWRREARGRADESMSIITQSSRRSATGDHRLHEQQHRGSSLSLSLLFSEAPSACSSTRRLRVYADDGRALRRRGGGCAVRVQSPENEDERRFSLSLSLPPFLFFFRLLHK